ncbi:tolloid-like protein 2, partial [Argonauta hians]
MVFCSAKNSSAQILAHSSLPRIVTTDGHLIFMTGANHNITFKSSAGGSVNIDDHDISQMMVSQQKSSQELKTDVDRMKRDQQTFKAKVYNNITQKLNGMIENYGRLKRSLETLNQTLSGSGNNLVTRIVSLERKAKFDPQVLQATVDRLSSQVSSLLSPSTESPRARRELRRLGQRVTQLEVSLREVKTNLEKENCESSPCLHGGTCYNRYNGYYCSCTPGWMGLRCSEDVNECSEFVGTTFGCQNGGTCLNTYGSYRCQCTANWHGVHCNSRHDDCSGSSTAELCGHGTCINVVRQQPNQPNYKCICDPGWTTSSNGPSCTEDIDECSSRGSPCFKHSQVTCYNTPGSFHCSACPAGFTGNGFSCMDINECEVNNGGCSRVPLVDCINTYGSRTCGPCPGDYSGDGTVCRYVGLCHRNNGGCHPLATCTENTNVPDQRVCVCTAGYSGSGIGPNGCTRHDPCENNECAQGSTCSVTSPTSYTCVCQPGHYGEHCYQIEDGCSPNPCMNGGTCILEGNLRYNCVCNSSFTGEQCQTAVSDCGGTLTGTHGSIIYPSVAGTHYPNDINCEWLIDVAFGKVVNINFTSIDMECGFDYVDVHDGIDRFANSLGRFCNLASLPEDPLTSSTNKIFLKFRSDSAVTNTGFRLNWTAQQPECGKVISGKTHGTIKSPGYPGNYAHRLDCVWTISAQPDQDITVQFADFSLEHSSTCRYDYLQFRNGITSDAPSLGKFCGRRLPQHVRSTEPYMYIKFVTDFSGTDKGFLLTFATTRDRHGCGGRRPEREGVIASANFPNSYGSNGDCVWIIQPQHTVIFTFDSMDLPGERPCLTDYVEV